GSGRGHRVRVRDEPNGNAAGRRSAGCCAQRRPRRRAPVARTRCAAAKDCVMTTNRIVRSSARFITYVTGLAAGLYAARAAATWLRYGRVKPSGWGERDAQLDCFMPVYEVADRNHIAV